MDGPDPPQLQRAGTHYLTGNDPAGPFDWSTRRLLLGDDGRHHGAKLVRDRGAWWCLAWLATGPDGGFVGTLSDPWHVTWGHDGLALGAIDRS